MCSSWSIYQWTAINTMPPHREVRGPNVPPTPYGQNIQKLPLETKMKGVLVCWVFQLFNIITLQILNLTNSCLSSLVLFQEIILIATNLFLMGPVRLYFFTLRVGTHSSTSTLTAGKRHIQVHRYKDFSDMKYVMLLMVAYAKGTERFVSHQISV